MLVLYSVLMEGRCSYVLGVYDDYHLASAHATKESARKIGYTPIIKRHDLNKPVSDYSTEFADESLNP